MKNSRKKHGYLILICFCFFAFKQEVVAQGEANVWYFGIKAGLDFNGGGPVVLSNGQTNQFEGAASICDAAGNLLFYTDGLKVWNRNHIVMPNGNSLFGGGGSSTQAALIVPKPGSSTIYYVFTSDYEANPKGISYTEIDMTLAGGLGGVTVNKNILLNTSSCEKLIGVRHCNKKDVWVVTHDWNSDAFRTYLVSSTGINLVPVISNVGLLIGGHPFNASGCLKASPNGTKIASATSGGNTGPIKRFEVFDFNNSTGELSHPILFPSYNGAYGVEFSPDGTKLYGATLSGKTIYQFDLCAGSDAAIANSGVIIGTYPVTSTPGTLQLGPDHKIYSTRVGQPWLAVINNPNALGVACNFAFDGIALATNSMNNLPNFISDYLKPPSQPTPFTGAIKCDTGNFVVPLPVCTNATGNSPSFVWYFGDPSSGLNNTSSSATPSHVFTQNGNYVVSLITNYACGSDTISQSINIVGKINVIQNPIICSGSSFMLPDNTLASTAGTYVNTIKAFNGCDSIITTNLTLAAVVTTTQNPTICSGSVFNLPKGIPTGIAGTYIDTLITSNSCDSIITTHLNVYTITSDQYPIICKGSSFVLPAGKSVSSAGTYTDTLTTPSGCDSVIKTNLIVTPIITFVQNASICLGETFPSPKGPINVAGTYYDTLKTAGGCDSAVTTVLTVKPTAASIQNVTVCSNEGYTFPNGTTVYTSSIYRDTVVSVNGCDSVIIINLGVNPSPIVGISPDVTIGAGTATTLTASGFGTYNWNPTIGLNSTTGNSVIASPAITTKYCVDVTSPNGCKDSACVTVIVESICPEIEQAVLPNAFSPNADGMNDEFCITGWKGCLESFNIKIYDRWGEKVFESNNSDFCWDGDYNGKKMDPQVFIYNITAKYLKTNKTNTKKGNISLIR